MRIVLTTLAVLLVLAVTACGDLGAEGTQVVATTPQLADFARQVGGDRFEVKTLLPPNVDPHDFEPRPSDAEAVARAKVLLRSGGEVDEWLDDLVDAAGGDAEVVDVGEEIGARGEDPHWWQDPLMTFRAVGVVWDALRA